ncbi:SDR family NAD(P)-dependent oxidoreductase [Flavobacterium sp.]|uniref:SDR family NAD(P)-dependent oxidoreductase n=1 Tax=Flavobacterium sp. TaxID=239 RepID=UPI0039C8A764
MGLNVTEAVLQTGDNVVATVRKNPEELAAKFGNNPNLHVVTMDTTNEEQTIAAAASAIAKFGKIDVLVNNAGYGLLSAVEEATAKEVFDNFNVNVFGVLNTTRAILPYMRERRLGHIINISSVGGLSAYFGWGVYGSTKFAIEGITEALALELAPLGIHATVVAPGFFRTNFLDESSLTRTANVIEDYSETVGEMRKFATIANNNQPGDPKKLAAAFIKLAASENPPVHLPLGSDSLERFRTKTKDFEQDIANWHDTIIGTDHDDRSK